MKVELVSITQPLIETADFDKVRGNRYLSPEELIVYCARVSNPSNQLKLGTAPKLIKYCIQHGHWSVFEQVGFSVSITTSRAIAAQILRHRSFTFQEFSQRYAEVQEFEPIALRSQDTKNRQNSVDDVDDSTKAWFYEQYNKLLRETEWIYEQLLEKGIAKECARFVLPLSTQTNLFMNGSLRSWLTYLNVRLHKDTQLEHREISHEVRDIIIKEFPNVSEAFNNFEDAENNHIL
jgi:thymidylate synthase (FAD)